MAELTTNRATQEQVNKVPLAENHDRLDNLPDPGAVEHTWEEEHNRFVATRALQLMQSDFDGNSWKACWETVVADRPAAAVARQLGMTIAAVYTAKSRVLRRLRKELEGLF